MPTVEFTKENVMKCACSRCPVQAGSACVAEKRAKLSEAMEAGMEGMPSAVDVPNVYCSTGIASCDDLDLSKTCICGGCPVWAENGLTQWKYCELGSAATVE